MSARRASLLVALFFVAGNVRGGDHDFDAYTAGSYLSGSGSEIRLGGWHVAGAATAGRNHRNLSFVADISAHFLGQEKEGDAEADLTQLTLMLGPRLTFRGGHGHQPFVQVMLLGAMLRTGGLQDRATSTGALAVGAGVDLPLGLAKAWGLRLQADLLQPWSAPESSDFQRSLRVSVGLLYRFHSHK